MCACMRVSVCVWVFVHFSYSAHLLNIVEHKFVFINHTQINPFWPSISLNKCNKTVKYNILEMAECVSVCNMCVRCLVCSESSAELRLSCIWSNFLLTNILSFRLNRNAMNMFHSSNTALFSSSAVCVRSTTRWAISKQCESVVVQAIFHMHSFPNTYS